jgi:AcrR family transcriptional regulator
MSGESMDTDLDTDADIDTDLDTDAELAEAEVPNWQKRSVDRSLRSARARAQKRSDRFVAAALELIEESEDHDFTLQDVLDRTTMSVRTFYNFFDGKDSLLLAVYETILEKTAVPILRERTDGVTDPVQRVKAFFETMAEIYSTPDRLTRALSLFHLRLAQSRPQDLIHALEPLHKFIVELLEGVAAAGQLRDDVEISALAAMLQELMLADAHSSVLAGTRMRAPGDLWAFCSAAILRPGKATEHRGAAD